MYGWKGTGRVTNVQPVRDVLMRHAKCGMHGMEIDRLARGESKVKVLQGQGAIAGTITFVHKSGRVHVQSVDVQALGAALRLQSRGAAPADWWVRQVVNRAAKSTGLEPLRMGELRPPQLRHLGSGWRCSSATRCESAWMARDVAWTTSSSSGCGAASSTRRCASTPTPTYARHGQAPEGGCASTTLSVLFRRSVRIPAMPITDSGPSRSPVPEHAEHRNDDAGWGYFAAFFPPVKLSAFRIDSPPSLRR